MGFLRTIGLVAVKFLGYTTLDPLDKDFPRLPPGKYGQYVCEICIFQQALRWHEKTKVKICDECILKFKGWL